MTSSQTSMADARLVAPPRETFKFSPRGAGRRRPAALLAPTASGRFLYIHKIHDRHEINTQQIIAA